MMLEKKTMTMARACIKCRVFVIIEPNDAENQVTIKLFEEIHKGHNLVTLDLEEVINQYIELIKIV